MPMRQIYHTPAMNKIPRRKIIASQSKVRILKSLDSGLFPCVASVTVSPGALVAGVGGAERTFTGTVVGLKTSTKVCVPMTVVFPVSPDKFPLIGTLVEPGITTFNAPDTIVVRPGREEVTWLTEVGLGIDIARVVSWEITT